MTTQKSGLAYSMAQYNRPEVAAVPRDLIPPPPIIKKLYY
jgi:hypothetical protein